MTTQVGEVWQVAWLTLRVSGAAVLIASAIGIPLGAWLGLARHRAKPLVALVVHTGMALPPVVVGLVLYLLLSRNGPLAVLDWLFTAQAMVAAQVILALPFVVGITMAVVAAVPPELDPQVRSLGASHLQARMAVLRETRIGIALAVAIALGRSLSEVGAVLIVGGNVRGHTRVLTTAIVLETGKGNFTVALALGGVLLALALALNAVVVYLGGRPAP